MAMQGQDPTTGNVKTIAVDASGNLKTVSGTGSGTSSTGVGVQLVAGTDTTNVNAMIVATTGTTISVAPALLVAGQDNANRIRALPVGNGGNAAGTLAVTVGGKDTANSSQQILVEANGRSTRISEGVADSVGSGVTAAAPTANTVLSTATLASGLVYKAFLNYSITGAIETSGQNLAVQMNGVTIFTVPTNNGSVGGLAFPQVVIPRVTASGNFVLRVLVVAGAVASTVYSTTLVITQIA